MLGRTLKEFGWSLSITLPLFVAALAPLTGHCPAYGQEGPVVSRRLERSSGGMPTVEVRLAGRQVRMALDTGATRTMISGELASELGLVARERFSLHDAGDVVREASCAGPITLDLDGVALRSNCLGWIPNTRRVGRVDRAAGVLGFDALSSADVWIDLEHRRLIVAPPGGLHGRFNGIAVGLQRRFGRPMMLATPESGPLAARQLRLVVDSGSDTVVLFGDAARTAARSASHGLPSIVSAAYSRHFVSSGHVGRVRIGAYRTDLAQARLLPDVRGRAEDGVVPLSLLGPVLFEAGSDTFLLAARPLGATPQ